MRERNWWILMATFVVSAILSSSTGGWMLDPSSTYQSQTGQPWLGIALLATGVSLLIAGAWCQVKAMSMWP